MLDGRERRNGIGDQRDVITEAHGAARGGFDARVRDQADDDEVRDAAGLQLVVQVGTREATRAQVLASDDVAVGGCEFGQEVAAEPALREDVGSLLHELRWMQVLPSGKASGPPAM